MNSSSYKWGNTLDAHDCIVNETIDDDVTTYSYTDTGKSTNVAGFKHGEHYRLGLQFQYKTGKWSQPVFIDDKINTTEHPSLYVNTDINLCIQNVPIFRATLS